MGNFINVHCRKNECSEAVMMYSKWHSLHIYFLNTIFVVMDRKHLNLSLGVSLTGTNPAVKLLNEMCEDELISLV
jgi:hypothetical protein